MDRCIEWTKCKDKWGYGQVWVKGNVKRIHRVTFERHHGYLPPVVRHTCDNPACYNIDHLLPGTQADNVADCVQRNRQGRASGERNHHAKLTENNVREIKYRLAAGETCAELARQYDIHQNTISDIKTGRSWKHLVLGGDREG